METTTNHPDIGADLSLHDQREAVLTAVVMSLPGLLAKIDNYQATTIVAGLLKAHMNRPSTDIVSTEDDLDSIIRQAREEADRDVEY